MGPDQAAELARHLLIEAMLLSAPMLVAGLLISVALSLLQTLTGVQEQTITAVPRLIVVFVAGIASMPWFLHRARNYNLHLWSDIHRYLG